METSFDAAKFVTNIGERLVRDFHEAREATSPTTVADAMETPVRFQLENILPRGVAVGSGFVIDSTGGTSRQCDVILYERDICPVFSVNDTPGTAYYPCEGVIAVGEVKSTLAKKELEDAFKKIASVKQLQRYERHLPAPHPVTGEPVLSERPYGSMHGGQIVDITKKLGPDEHAQIFGFVIAGDLKSKSETFLNAFADLVQVTGDKLSPNMVAILSGGILYCGTSMKGKLQPKQSAQTADLFMYAHATDAFRILISWIYATYRNGKTSDSSAFDRYFANSDSSGTAKTILELKRDIPIERILKSLLPRARYTTRKSVK